MDGFFPKIKQLIEDMKPFPAHNRQTVVSAFPWVFLVFFFPALLLAPMAALGSKTDSLIPSYQLLLFGKSKQKIFIIGASTVRYDNNLPGDRLQSGDYQYPRTGWGSELYRYMRNPANVSNQARRGATSFSYRQDPLPINDPDYKGPGCWTTTRTMRENTPVAERGFLLIQFGANDFFHNVGKNTFQANLRFYRDQAFDLDMTPVFVTPVDSRAQGDNRGNYPAWMIEVAEENLPPQYAGRKVFLLDLHERSLDRFGTATTRNLGYVFGNVPYLWRNDGTVNGVAHSTGDFQRMDTTHFEQRGAIRVAGWVRDLACEQADQSLCNLFKQNADMSPPTIYFTGEYIDDPNDPEINGWYIANPDGTIRSGDMNDTAIIEKTHDQETDTTVLAFNTYGSQDKLLEHGFHNSTDARSWANNSQTHIGWNALFTSLDFRIYVEVTTTDGVRHLTYKPVDVDEGPGNTLPWHLRFGLGSDANDGTWKTIQRDLAADLHKFEPTIDLIQVNGIRIRGTGRIDNLRMF